VRQKSRWKESWIAFPENPDAQKAQLDTRKYYARATGKISRAFGTMVGDQVKAIEGLEGEAQKIHPEHEHNPNSFTARR